ncbi:LacI family DNA-binding transcriptional regulator [Collimonas silvisoli]|uniref:LacI family DNA-binding transcriptional regulator n=1 Tax=Collimonas silvisoli TaxID=2825884 RepID=UPI001B8B7262|nr:LacI family DNA-binding transcriptional regulator [Collimonas silvisoli]
MTTIQDVAARAKVSVSSVSNVLNGRTDRLGAAAFERVEAAIRELDYHPNQIARQLKTGHIPMLGLLVPSTANPMYGHLALQIESVAKEQYGYRVLLGNTYRDKDQESRMFDDLMSFGVRAVILVSSWTDERYMDAAISRGLAVVSYDRRAYPDENSFIDHVSPDNFRAAFMAARHLIELGHTRLAFLSPASKTNSRTNKIAGFLAAAQEAGLENSAQIIDGPGSAEYADSALAELGYEMAAHLLDQPHPPTGVVTVNDMMAIGLMAGLRNAGLSVPEQVSVIGIDDLILSKYSNPPLTTVRLPIEEMAQTMVQRVMLRLSQPQLAPEEFLFEPSLIMRGSAGAPPAPTPVSV